VHQPIVAVKRKAIQSLHPAGFATAFGRAEVFSRRGGSGTAEGRALMMCGEGRSGWWVIHPANPSLMKRDVGHPARPEVAPFARKSRIC
jgi:hypothetical protein